MPDGPKSREQLLQEWRERRARAAASAASTADGSRQSRHATSNVVSAGSGAAPARPSAPPTRDARGASAPGGAADAQTGPLPSAARLAEPPQGRGTAASRLSGEARSAGPRIGDGESTSGSSSSSEGSASRHGVRPPRPRAVCVGPGAPTRERRLAAEAAPAGEPAEAVSTARRRQPAETAPAASQQLVDPALAAQRQQPAEDAAGRWHQLQAPTPPPSVLSRSLSESSGASRHGATPQPPGSARGTATAERAEEDSRETSLATSSARKEAARSRPQHDDQQRTRADRGAGKPPARAGSQRSPSPDDGEADGVGSIAARLRWLKRESVLASGPASGGGAAPNGGPAARAGSWDQGAGRGGEVEPPSSSGPGSLRRLAASIFDEDQEWCAAVSHGLNAQLTRSRDGATDETRIRELAELVKLLRRSLRQSQAKTARFVESAIRIERDAEMYVESAKLAGESEASALASELAKARREAAAAAADRSADRAALQMDLDAANGEAARLKREAEAAASERDRAREDARQMAASAAAAADEAREARRRDAAALREATAAKLAAERAAAAARAEATRSATRASNAESEAEGARADAERSAAEAAASASRAEAAEREAEEAVARAEDAERALQEHLEIHERVVEDSSRVVEELERTQAELRKLIEERAELRTELEAKAKEAQERQAAIEAAAAERGARDAEELKRLREAIAGETSARQDAEARAAERTRHADASEAAAAEATARADEADRVRVETEAARDKALAKATEAAGRAEAAERAREVAVAEAEAAREAAVAEAEAARDAALAEAAAARETAKAASEAAEARVASLQERVALLRSSLEGAEARERDALFRLERLSSELEALQECAAGDKGGDATAALSRLVKRVGAAEAAAAAAEAARRELHNRLVDMRGAIRVLCRVRPSRGVESRPPAVRVGPDGHGVRVRGQDGRDQEFSFDRVLDGGANQAAVFEEVRDLVQSAADGYEVCIFSYGQTGAGKTWTMSGGGRPEEQGIAPRAVKHVLDCVARARDAGWEASISAESVEIYNETIRDLLCASGEGAGISLRPEGGAVGASRVILETAEDAERVSARSAAARAAAATNMNARSSRSHAVLTLRLELTHAEQGVLVRGALHLVDLAGSERLARSGATGDRARETAAINRSLSALGDVFSALASGAAHVPYRNSKLTHLLAPALGGTGKTLMVVNVDPSADSAHESLCSLRFASQVGACETAARGGAKRHVSSLPAAGENDPPSGSATKRKASSAPRAASGVGGGSVASRAPLRRRVL